MSEKLKPCPFCGSDKIDVDEHKFHDLPSTYGVKCFACKAQTYQFLPLKAKPSKHGTGGVNKMSKTKVYFCMCWNPSIPSLEQQANQQGFTFGWLKDTYHDLWVYLYRLHDYKFITDSEYYTIKKRFLNKIQEDLLPLRKGELTNDYTDCSDATV